MKGSYSVSVWQSIQKLIKNPRKCHNQDSQGILCNAIWGCKSCKCQGKTIPNLVAKSTRALKDKTVYVYKDSYLI